MPPPRDKPRDSQRIAKLLARAGIASRREVERMIAEGRIAIGGKIVETPATLLTSLHGVTVDGRPVRAPDPARLFRYHKPAGLLTTERDPKGRPTIYDRLPPGLPRVMPVGRLDLNTEGLLLLTTDGELKRQLELPSTGVERIYRARVFGEISQDRLEDLIQGVEIEGIRYGPIDANLERRTGRNAWIELRLTEGKNREVRRVLEHLGLQVSRLLRTAYGPFPLADLPVGAVDEVRQHDLVAFRKHPTSPVIHPPSGAAARTARHDRPPARDDRRQHPPGPAGKAGTAKPGRPVRTRPRAERDEIGGSRRPSRPGQRPARKAAVDADPGRAGGKRAAEAKTQAPRGKSEAGPQRPAAKPGLARTGRKPPSKRPRRPRP